MASSKPIRKIDDEAKALIIETLQGDQTGGLDIDCLYRINDQFCIIEFLKCDTVRPNESHPNRYWHKNRRKFLSLWRLVQALRGRLYLVNYEASREQFKVIRVLRMTDAGIQKQVEKRWTAAQFRKWFRMLNRLALEGNKD